MFSVRDLHEMTAYFNRRTKNEQLTVLWNSSALINRSLMQITYATVSHSLAFPFEYNDFQIHLFV